MFSEEIDFLQQSNEIEGEGFDAMQDSIDAWEYIKPLFPLKAEQILRCHQILMSSRKTIPEAAKGAWTKVRTRVGMRVNPPPDEVPQLIDSWIKRINKDIEIFNYDIKASMRKVAIEIESEINAESAKRYHIRFEQIHPFQDGNGRVGRILYNWHRLRLGLPIHVIRVEDRNDYYSWFR